MRRFAVALAALMLTSSTALAAEALLIRHEVLSVPVGTELELKPGFFIGKAWMADPTVAEAGLQPNLRQVRLQARAPGRTIVSTWSLTEPNKRIEYEIVVMGDNRDAMFPSLLAPATAMDDTATTMPTEAAMPIEEAEVAEETK